MDDSDDEVEEEVGEEEVGEVLEPRPPPPPTPPEVPKKPSYVIEAACKKFEVPQEAVLFSAYRPVAVKDGALMVSSSYTVPHTPSACLFTHPLTFVVKRVPSPLRTVRPSGPLRESRGNIWCASAGPLTMSYSKAFSSPSRPRPIPILQIREFFAESPPPRPSSSSVS